MVTANKQLYSEVTESRAVGMTGNIRNTAFDPEVEKEDPHYDSQYIIEATPAPSKKQQFISETTIENEELENRSKKHKRQRNKMGQTSSEEEKRIPKLKILRKDRCGQQISVEGNLMDFSEQEPIGRKSKNKDSDEVSTSE